MAQYAPLPDVWGWRVGGQMSGLFNSGQGRPLVYFDMGFRLKKAPLYVDLKLPILMGGFDAMLFLFQSEVLKIRSASDFARLFNDETHMLFIEPVNTKIGWSLKMDGYDFNVGGAALVDFVFFQSLLQNVDPDDFEGIDDSFATDPLVIMVGGFLGFSTHFDDRNGMFDLAVGGGPDVFSFDSEYQPNSGFVIFLDGELVYQWTHHVGGYVRARLSTYTHMTDPLSVTLVTNFGAIIRM
jgi:hypothetical protein